MDRGLVRMWNPWEWLKFFYESIGHKHPALSAIGFMLVFALIGLLFWFQLDRQYEKDHQQPKSTQMPHALYYDAVKEALTAIGADGIKVIRHLEMHGGITFSASQTPPLPGGMTTHETQTWLELFVNKGLVTPTHVMKPTGGVAAIPEDTYRIAPGREAAVKEVLHESQ